MARALIDLHLEQSNEVILKCLVDNKLLVNEIKCTKCKVSMKYVTRQCLDGYAWRCPECRTFKSIRAGSFFENLRFNMNHLIKLIYYFSIEHSQTKVAKALKISRSSVVDYFHKLRYNILIIKKNSICNSYKKLKVCLC